MADDKDIDATARIKAHDVAYTMAIQIYNIYCDAVVEIQKDRASRFLVLIEDKPKTAL